MNHPPVIRSAKIVPAVPTLANTLSVETQAEDQDGDGIAFRYVWSAQGVPIPGQTEARLKPTMLKRGDRVQADVTPVDVRGAVGNAFRTEEVELVNAPPVIKQVSLEPAVARPGDTLQARVDVSDADGDTIRLEYQWWRNGRVVTFMAEVTDPKSLPTAKFTRGDEIIAGVTPFDAAGAGQIVYSDPVVLGNRPPTITSTPSASIEKGRLEYVLTAVDPDHDVLAFRLIAAPPGMTIDNSGRIAWDIPEGAKGAQRVRVSVEDGQGGQAFQEFTITLP